MDVTLHRGRPRPGLWSSPAVRGLELRRGRGVRHPRTRAAGTARGVRAGVSPGRAATSSWLGPRGSRGRRTEELLVGFLRDKLGTEHRYLAEHRSNGLPIGSRWRLAPRPRAVACTPSGTPTSSSGSRSSSISTTTPCCAASRSASRSTTAPCTSDLGPVPARGRRGQGPRAAATGSGSRVSCSGGDLLSWGWRSCGSTPSATPCARSSGKPRRGGRGWRRTSRHRAPARHRGRPRRARARLSRPSARARRGADQPRGLERLKQDLESKELAEHLEEELDKHRGLVTEQATELEAFREQELSLRDEVEQQAGTLATLTEDLAGHRESLATRTQELAEAEASLVCPGPRGREEEAEARTRGRAARLAAAELEREVAAQRGIVDGPSGGIRPAGHAGRAGRGASSRRASPRRSATRPRAWRSVWPPRWDLEGHRSTAATLRDEVADLGVLVTTRDEADAVRASRDGRAPRARGRGPSRGRAGPAQEGRLPWLRSSPSGSGSGGPVWHPPASRRLRTALRREHAALDAESAELRGALGLTETGRGARGRAWACAGGLRVAQRLRAAKPWRRHGGTRRGRRRARRGGGGRPR